MRARREELVDSNGRTAEVVVVTFARPRVLAGYRRRFAEPLTVVADEERLSYAALGFGRGSFWRVWGWKAAKKYWELLRSGHRLGRPPENDADTRQLGGNAVIAADGRLAWVFAGDGPDDRPTADELIAAVAACS